ncbi:MAG: CRISPR-associated endonuclease Cas1 [gamma proteobacterium endosymbiont of Lamellibrachia anaximandri]|nr:CRISPR-associated endonuclease Cas1 [gamma proteobacterium endosymbiont of Lamellibrachia anaximandri]MBL3535497.1 CRISPR-associated endonuclease Cas1 [gamma proteobacterium endosymbiont of Lamellibrachia anaximandri]
MNGLGVSVDLPCSFGYTLLFHNVHSLILARGLNPNIGLLHSERAGHPALASDLIEEFRAPIVDTLVLKLLLNRKLLHDDFRTDHLNGSCKLSDPARQLFIRAFEEKMNTRLIHPETSQKIDYRRAIDGQISRLITTLRDPAIPYRPFIVR